MTSLFRPGGTNALGQTFTQQIPLRPGITTDGLSPGAAALLNSLNSLGLPGISMTSGYRDPNRNARAGGANSSQHIHGNAMDLDITQLQPADRTRLLDHAVANGARGIGIYPGGNSLHLDVRETPTAWGPHPEGAYKGVSDVNLYPDWARGTLGKLLAQQAGAQQAAPTQNRADMPPMQRAVTPPPAQAPNPLAPSPFPVQNTDIALETSPAQDQSVAKALMGAMSQFTAPAPRATAPVPFQQPEMTAKRPNLGAILAGQSAPLLIGRQQPVA